MPSLSQDHPTNPLRHVSYSELSSYRQCPHRHFLSKIEAWQSPKVSPALTRGKVFHQALAEHYSALKDPTPLPLRDELNVVDGQRYITVEDRDPVVNAQHVIEAVEDDETRDLLSWMLDGYVEVYGRDETARIVADALEHNAFGSDYVQNILSFRARLRPEPGPLHVTRRQDLLELSLPEPDLDVYTPPTETTP